MPHYALFSLLVASAVLPSVFAQSSSSSAFVPLASKQFSYNNLPEQADPANGVRGTQYGYNICNSTTQNQQSLCQTLIMNSLNDFCLWGPPTTNQTIGATEGIEVAYCATGNHGSRVFLPNTFTGLQFMTTPSYIQVVGFMDQTKVGLNADDYGGELDPHGADLRGNPLGALVFSTAWSNNASVTGYQQVVEWHNFIGGGFFCFKACNPFDSNSTQYCQNIFDRIGCAYNAPNNAQNGTFESCDGDNQDPPGIYTSNGVIMTYTQPAESLGPITTMPYQPRVPASSNCQTFTSASLFTVNTQVPSSTPVPSGSGSVPGSTPSRTGASSNPTSTKTSGASGIVASSITTILGVAFAVAFFA